MQFLQQDIFGRVHVEEAVRAGANLDSAAALELPRVEEGARDEQIDFDATRLVDEVARGPFPDRARQPGGIGVKVVPKCRQQRSHLVVRQLHEDICVD